MSCPLYNWIYLKNYKAFEYNFFMWILTAKSEKGFTFQLQICGEFMRKKDGKNSAP